MYAADSQNIHSVDEIIYGERLTLTLWFTCDVSHDEDAKLISMISDRCSCNFNTSPASYTPSPASSNMYWFPPDQDSDHRGFDIRYARLFIPGYGLYSPQDCPLHSNFSYDISELVMKPLMLVKEDELCVKEFVNILHALQAVQLRNWKGSELSISEDKNHFNVVPISTAWISEVLQLKSEFVRNMQLDETIFGHFPFDKTRKDHFDWLGPSVPIKSIG